MDPGGFVALDSVKARYFRLHIFFPVRGRADIARLTIAFELGILDG
jgi:hypothetical protein